jgi:hypothetical protein
MVESFQQRFFHKYLLKDASSFVFEDHYYYNMETFSELIKLGSTLGNEFSNK